MKNAFRNIFICLGLLALLPFNATRASAGDGEDVFDAHASSYRYYFQDADMDFHFGNLLLGSVKNGGAQVGEAFYAASQIEDGETKSWGRVWCELAQRVEARGEESLDGGHVVSARDQFLRASNYYRVSLLGMPPDNPQFEHRARKSRRLMRKAGALFETPLEYFEIPFEDMLLPGYFRRGAASGEPSRTLLMIGGGETFAEDLVFYLGPQAHARGYNFMTVDLPGQGMTPLAGHVFRTNTYLAMQAVVNYALRRPETLPEGLAAFGISGGGLFVPQAAARDPRIKAIAMSSAVVDAESLFATMPAALATDAEKSAWSPFHADVVRSICWRYGVPLDDPSKLIDANRGNVFDPASIAAPALIIVGGGEYNSEEVRRQQQLVMERLPHPNKRLVITPTNEGATNHCIMENRSLVGQALFDFLDVALP